MQKEVRIIGFELKQNMGILKAHKLSFDKDNKLIIFKGSVGQGKSTEHKAIQLSTQGSKTLVDKQLYGNSIDTEVQLIDGDLPVWVGCRSDKLGKLVYSLYIKDNEGKIVKEPVIDGIKATPAKYLETLQTELTWKMDELTSENPTTQKKILLSLYQHQLSKLGVIMDKKHPEYKDSILGKIDSAEEIRNQKDSLRKQIGGIADDLKANGFDPDRPATIPDSKDIQLIIDKIDEQKRLKTVEQTKAEGGNASKLQEIKTEGVELVSECKDYNTKLQAENDFKKKEFDENETANKDIYESVDLIGISLKKIAENKGISQEYVEKIAKIIEENLITKYIPEPAASKLIEFDDNNKIILTSIDSYPENTKVFLQKAINLREKYLECLNATVEQIDTAKFDNEIIELEKEKKTAEEINNIVKAVDSFHAWRKADGEVKKLKDDYAKLLSSVDTGVAGLKIVPEESEDKFDIFLMYNGEYDSTYFNNPEKEYRKLSSYSGTQKPIICLLIQNHLLSLRSKAMRYMFIDNIPMDKKTIELLRNMCEKLNLTVFLNITGDFTSDSINDGEVLIEGGEVLFS